jgi:magnesium transporter
MNSEQDTDSVATVLASDENTSWAEQPWVRMAELAEANEQAALTEFVDELSGAETALSLSRLEPDSRQRVLRVLSAEASAELIRKISETQAAQILGDLQADEAAEILEELPPDEQADVLNDLEDEHADAIVRQLSAENAAATRELRSYEDNVAGGLMVCDFLKFSQRQTVGDVIRQLTEEQSRYREINLRYGYVCDRRGRLVGVLPMQSLLFVDRGTPLSELMIRQPLSVVDTMSLDELIDFFDSHSFMGVPVLDDSGVLLGVVSREAVDHEAVRAAENDYLKSQGIVGGEELRTMPLLLRSRRRLSWLSINILLNLGAAAVIASFQETLQSVIALAVFLPIISDMSGCSGNQAVAVSMRELSLGLLRPSEFARVWKKEVSVGLINGVALGLLIGLLAVVFKGNAYLGVVVGTALCANTILAVSIGGMLPLGLKRLGFDPAVSSGPLLTTVTDMCGFFLVLGLATLMLSKLVTGG